MGAVLLLFALAAAPNDAGTIRSLRMASNAAIAAHDVEGSVAHMEQGARILASSGSFIEGTPAMREAFGRSFADANFVKFVRTPEQIEPEGEVAAERGTWRGIWRDRTITGRYLARWAKRAGDWRIMAEMFVPTACRGAGCAR